MTTLREKRDAAERERIAHLEDYSEGLFCKACNCRSYKVRRIKFGDGNWGRWFLQCANCEIEARDVTLAVSDA